MIRRFLQWLHSPQRAASGNAAAIELGTAKIEGEARRQFEAMQEWYAPYARLPQRAASELAKHGAAMRRESERARVLAKMNALRRELGMGEYVP